MLSPRKAGTLYMKFWVNHENFGSIRNNKLYYYWEMPVYTATYNGSQEVLDYWGCCIIAIGILPILVAPALSSYKDWHID